MYLATLQWCVYCYIFDNAQPHYLRSQCLKPLKNFQSTLCKGDESDSDSPEPKRINTFEEAHDATDSDSGTTCSDFDDIPPSPPPAPSTSTQSNQISVETKKIIDALKSKANCKIYSNMWYYLREEIVCGTYFCGWRTQLCHILRN